MTTVLLDHRTAIEQPPARTRTDERLARRTLRDQIARLEEELSGLFCSAWPRKGLAPLPPRASTQGPRVLSLSELEERRDELSARASHLRRALAERTRREEENRRLMEEMLLEPERYPWVRVSHEDIGEPGCRHWHVRPRRGVLGMLLRWWRVHISSGCPLAARLAAAASEGAPRATAPHAPRSPWSRTPGRWPRRLRA